MSPICFIRNCLVSLSVHKLGCFRDSISWGAPRGTASEKKTRAQDQTGGRMFPANAPGKKKK